MRNDFDDDGLDDDPFDDRFDDAHDDAHDDRGPERHPPGLPPPQGEALVAAIHAHLREQPCDSTLRAAREWAARAGVDWPRLERELEDSGGFCDCEVLMNIYPDAEG